MFRLRTFRDTWATPALAMLLLVFPLLLSAEAGSYLLAGVTMAVGNGSDMHGTHQSSRLELLTLTLAPLCAASLGLGMLVLWQSTVIRTNARGIRKFGFLGRPTFQANWGDLRRVSKYRSERGSMIYVVHSRLDRLEFAETEHDLAGLLIEIRRAAPHLNFGPWD